MKIMHPIPHQLLRDLADEDRAKTLAWWETLHPEAQLEFIQCWDQRSDDTALHGISRDGAIEWHPLPIELHGRIVDDDHRIDDGLARRQLLEYINGHEEIQFFLTARSFHICRAHPGARVCLRSGVIPKDFHCEQHHPDCPMRAILAHAGGRSVELVPALRHRESGNGSWN